MARGPGAGAVSAAEGAELRAERYADAQRAQRRVRLAVSIAAAALVLAFVFMVWLAPVRAADDSMAPAIMRGDTVFFNKLYKFTTAPDRGGIFAYISADGVRLGRVAALPGERVEIAGGAVYINGVYLDESAYASGAAAAAPEFTVGKAAYFLMPDVRAEGETGVLVSADKLMGRALIRTAPAERAAFFG